MQLHNITGSFHFCETTSLLLKHLSCLPEIWIKKLQGRLSLALLIKAISSFLLCFSLCKPYLLGKKKKWRMVYINSLTGLKALPKEQHFRSWWLTCHRQIIGRDVCGKGLRTTFLHTQNSLNSLQTASELLIISEISLLSQFEVDYEVPHFSKNNCGCGLHAISCSHHSG